jgi:hypothetical protein
MGKVGEAIAGGGFVATWLLQALALQWIEGASIPEIVRTSSNTAFTSWIIIYVGAAGAFGIACWRSFGLLRHRKSVEA